MVTNKGYIYMPSLLADNLYRDLSPVVPKSDTGSVPDFQTYFITLASNVGMYQDIITDSRIEVAPTRNVQRCKPNDVTSPTSLAIHLAERCGITVEEMEKYVPYAMKYREDVCRSLNHSAQTRLKYARIFVHTQHRLLFFPFPNPVRDTYRVNSDWNFDQIIEYHRRAIYALSYPRAPIQGMGDINMADASTQNQEPPEQSNNGLTV
ncbi:hypothetical protein PM082_014970 [Marasmius tenuissimus]|nr:hypothetical protein PM082_014970 [Marasmius tenuissimus]